MTELLTATIQVSAMLLAGLCLAWLFRKKAASLRHAAIMIAMACAAIVPLLSIYMPAWPARGLEILPSLQIATTTRAMQGIATERDAPTAPQESSAPLPAVTLSQDHAQVHLPPLRDALLVVYIAGVIASLATLAAGLWRLSRMSARAEPLPGNRWQRRAATISVSYSMRRSIRLGCIPQEVLATWGMFRPQVLLPAGAEDWEDDRIRAVLLHELAHIRRNDWIVQILASLFRAIYWFNPLVWRACTRLRQESEQACDDAAIEQGEDNVEYAEHLLALARTLNAPEMARLPAAAMTHDCTLKRRIALLLDAATPHARTTGRSVVKVSALLLGITCAVAACDGRHKAARQPRQTPNAPAVQAVQEPGPAPVTTESANVATQPAAVPAALPEPHPEPRHAQRSAVVVVAATLDLVQSALADESLAVLDELTRPITGLHHIQRYAQAVVEDEGRDDATLAANYTEIINALTNTANLAANLPLRPRGQELPPQQFEKLANDLREKATELTDAVIPARPVTFIVVSTPERRAAISALDLAQTTQRDTLFVGPRSRSWLATELDTLERAAQSVLSDDGSTPAASYLKLNALMGSLRSTTRQANAIARRRDAREEVRSKAVALSTSVRTIAERLESAILRAN